jgi:lipopolysaccharide/colanic/teichoic acid biosynthesis glycosyltransferase
MAHLAKHLVDFVVAFFVLIGLSPVMVIIAVSVVIRLGRPILFTQVRPGRHERPFRMYKFRTMREAYDGHGRPLPDSERLTSLGRFLRSTSLDELPELINVLKGDMSLVGPRPLLMEYLPYYSARERRRFEVLPGITGWAQVTGRNNLPWDERLARDVWYVEHWSIWLDFKILWMTLFKVIRREHVQVDTSLTETHLAEERGTLLRGRLEAVDQRPE